jgi:hypothetical protein
VATAGENRGRARDPEIDARILGAANRHLAGVGYEAMSLTAAALEMAADAGPAASSCDPLADLVSELSDFQRGASLPGRLSLVGTMLQDSTAPTLRARYQAQVIAPRRARLLGILRRAGQLGLIDPDADLDVAITLCTGSWYARALAGLEPPENWPQRTAANG